MQKYNRYFEFRSGAFLDAMVAVSNQNQKSLAEIELIQKEIGATSKYVARDGLFVAFLFDTPPDPAVFRKLHGGYYPKKGTSLHARVSSLPFVEIKSCLNVVGLPDSPTLFDNRAVYFPSCTLLPWEQPVAYLSVPWYDEDPDVIEKYKAERNAGINRRANYDALLWTPPAESIEVKSWQVEKAIDEWNEHIAKLMK